MSGNWTFQASASGANILAQQYDVVINSSPVSQSDLGCSEECLSKASSCMHIEGRGGDGCDLKVIGIQIGTRIKLREMWIGSGESVVDARLSLCSNFFSGTYVDISTGKVGKIEGFRKDSFVTKGVEIDAKSYSQKAIILLLMAIGKLSGTWLSGLGAHIVDFTSKKEIAGVESDASDFENNDVTDEMN
jgi:hypothetical protein